MHYFCDTYPDCQDESDETNCSKFERGFFYLLANSKINGKYSSIQNVVFKATFNEYDIFKLILENLSMDDIPSHKEHAYRVVGRMMHKRSFQKHINLFRKPFKNRLYIRIKISI